MNISKDELIRKIRITRKCRIELAEYLLSQHKFYNFLTVYYSILIIVLSLVDINSSKFDGSSSILILSIILTIITVHINSLDLLNRYFNLKAHYIKLDSLIWKCMNNDENINSLQNEYNESLNAVENHSEREYIKAILNSPEELKWHKENDVNFIKEKEKKLKKYNRNVFLTKFILIILPFFCLSIFCLMEIFLK